MPDALSGRSDSVQIALIGGVSEIVAAWIAIAGGTPEGSSSRPNLNDVDQYIIKVGSSLIKNVIKAP